MPAPANCPTSGLADYYQIHPDDLADIVACSTCNNAPSGTAEWNGTFGPGSNCIWTAYTGESGSAMDGKALNAAGCLIQLDGANRKWTLGIRCFRAGSGQLVWYGEKDEGDTPEGVYTRAAGASGGCSTTPDTLRIQFIPIIAAWPGGQTDVTLNPQEKFTSADFGFSGNVDWNVGSGNVDGLILETLGTTANARENITVRYDTVSPSGAAGHMVLIEATSGGVTRARKRTIFKAEWTTLNFNGLLDPANNLRFFADAGDPNDSAGLNWIGQNNATRIAAKVEAVLTLSPSVDWTARGVKFIFGDSLPKRFSFRLERQKIVQRVSQVEGELNRIINPPNDPAWTYDGSCGPEDAQYPTGSSTKAFRLDAPGYSAPHYLQSAWRSDFRELAEWHDGMVSRRITPFSGAEWYANFTGDLPNNAQGNPTASGAGNPFTAIKNAQPVANAGPNQTVGQGAQMVTLDGSGSSDGDNDSLTYKWTQTAGPQATLSNDAVSKPTFTAPNAPAVLVFGLQVTDITQGLHHHKPNNSESTTASVTITVQ